MKRRDFLKSSIALGLLSGAYPFFGGLEEVMGMPVSNNSSLIAVRGGGPVEMFEKAMEAFGGMNRVVKKGDKVLVKPNIGWDAPPERAANTNPLLVGAIVKSCYDAGASEVVVFDHTCNKWDRCYSNSEIEKAVKENGGKMLPGNNETYYKQVNVPNGKVLKKPKVHQALLSSDVFINVPVLKHHSSTKLSLSMKNLMGVVWDRRFYHGNNLNQCIADFLTYRKPDLNIIDGYKMMVKNGPRGVSTSDVVNLKALIVSKDCVAADAAATKMFGLEPSQIEHIRIANDMGIGINDLTKVSIKKIKI